MLIQVTILFRSPLLKIEVMKELYQCSGNVSDFKDMLVKILSGLDNLYTYTSLTRLKKCRQNHGKPQIYIHLWQQTFHTMHGAAN